MKGYRIHSHDYPGRVAWGAILLLAGVFSPYFVGAQPVHTQTVDIQPGWNAVYLEVDPRPADPSALFAGLPIDVVATHIAPARGSQFVSNPGADLHLAYGWAVWYAPEREDTLLTTLYAVQGGRAYLLHARTNATLQIQGEVPTVSQVWTPDAYNFVGFPLRHPGGPTFGEFFGPSPAHRHNRIYRLVNGTWRQVTQPNTTVMRAGEAFWIYTQGRSDYRGPLDVRAASSFGVFLSGASSSDIIFRNLASHPITFTVAHVPGDHDDIPMAIEMQAYDEEAPGFRTVTYTFEQGGWVQPFPPLASGAGIRLPLRLHLSTEPVGRQFSLLRIESDLGTIVYVPVSALREELKTHDGP